MRLLIVAMCCAMLFAQAAQARSPTLQDMIELHNDLDHMCRGWSGDDPHTGEACDEREKVSKLIRAMGFCMAYPAYTWHKC